MPSLSDRGLKRPLEPQSRSLEAGGAEAKRRRYEAPTGFG